MPTQLWDRIRDYLKKPHEKVEEYTKAKAEILTLSYYQFLANWTKKGRHRHKQRQPRACP
jgi:hypothetical protein